MQNVVEHGVPPDPPTAALISLLLVGRVMHKVQPTTDRKAQKQRAQQLAPEDWVSAATRNALQDIAAGAAGG